MQIVTNFFFNKKYSFLFLFAFSLLSFGNKLQAQTVVKAVVDNYVVEPYGSQSLNVLKNDEVSCEAIDISVSITAAPQHGIATVRANKTIQYEPNADYFGADEFTYRIVCDGKASTAKVYIQVADIPDNMVPEVCAIDPPAFEWKIKEAVNSSPLKVTCARPWFVGNLDDVNDLDNKLPEIVASGLNDQNTITIFRNGNLNDPFTINIVLANHYNTVSGIGLSRFSDGKGAILVSGQDGYLHAYEYPSGNHRWMSSAPYLYDYGVSAANSIARSGAAIAFADFDADGTHEVYVANKIFSLDTGVLLCEGGINENKGFCKQNSTINGGMVSVAVDVDHDGFPELVAGNTVYKITNNSGAWSMSVYKKPTVMPKLKSGATVWEDGQVSLVDMNNDGYVDAFIQTIGGGTNANTQIFFAYGWDIHNDKILFTYEPQLPTASGRTGVGSRSLAFIGDIDGDGKPEIAFIEEGVPQTKIDAYLKAFKLPGTFGPTAKLVPFWSMSVNESAGRTGISLFDFNLDGVSEMIYRDETHLRIIDGSLTKQATPYNLATIPSVSSTTWEMPVIADVDGDGAAEIVCAGGEDGEDWVARGFMKIYKSGNSSQWAPARSVWNQYAYNPTFVNEDLTIPLSPLNMAASLHGADGVTRRPFNNFLQQAPIMTMEGVSLYAAANLLFDGSVPSRLNYDESTDKVTVSFGVMNDGNIVYKGPIDVQLYAYSSTTSKYTKVGTKFVYGTAASELGLNGKAAISYVITNFSGYLPADYDSWYLAINTIDASPNAPKYFAGQVECKEADNMTTRLSFVTKERTICEGVTEPLILPDTQAYRWYSSFTGGDTLATVAGQSNIKQFTKSPALVEYLFVESYRKGDLGNPTAKPIVNVRDTIFVYLTPDSLIWTGGVDGDWHDHLNWENPNDVFNKYPKANIPRLCTNVLINDGLTIYPDLSPSVTRSSEYSFNECNNIHFMHGGEVSQPDRLLYSKAYVQVSLDTHRRIMFSPPLQQLYSGDIYVNDKDPFKDDLFVSTYLFNEKNPQTGFYKEGSWTGKYNNPAVDFKAGSGLALWLSDKKDYPSHLLAPHDPFLFHFPKHDPQHHLYVSEGVIIPGSTVNLARGKEHRFVFDGLPNALGSFVVPMESTAAGKLMLIGNPYMAHLDFDKLRAANPGKLAAYYQVIDENGVYQYYNKSGSTLTKNIAPMQSIIVETAKAFTDGLQMNGAMTSNIPGDKLKSGGDELPSGGLPEGDDDVVDANVLTINLSDGKSGFYSRTSIILNPEASNAYVMGEDVPKILFIPAKGTDEAGVLYTRSIEKTPIMLSVNELNSLKLDSIDVILGIRGVREGRDLNFFITGQWNFARGYDLYLFDKYENKHYNLRDASWYYFKNTTSQDFLEDRFVIEIGSRVATGIDETPYSSIRVTGSHGEIVVESGDGSLLESIKVYDLQGRLVVQKEKANTDNLRIKVTQNQVYIVEVTSSSESTVRKVVTY